jgi:uncharacterized Zn finger protein
MTKIECANCGRKATVDVDRENERPPMKYCRRCGEKLPPQAEW